MANQPPLIHTGINYINNCRGLTLRASWGGASRPPPKRNFLITFDRLNQSKWNFASVYQIWIGIFWKNFGIIDDVIATWWRHHLLKMPKIGPPSNFFSLSHFLLKFCEATPLDIYFWGVGSIFCHLSVSCILQTGLKLPFLPKFAPGFYISGLESAIDLKFWPELDIVKTNLLAKFQPNRTSGCPVIDYSG